MMIIVIKKIKIIHRNNQKKKLKTKALLKIKKKKLKKLIYQAKVKLISIDILNSIKCD